jgi:hypothetical protein
VGGLPRPSRVPGGRSRPDCVSGLSRQSGPPAVLSDVLRSLTGRSALRPRFGAPRDPAHTVLEGVATSVIKPRTRGKTPCTTASVRFRFESASYLSREQSTQPMTGFMQRALMTVKSRRSSRPSPRAHMSVIARRHVGASTRETWTHRWTTSALPSTPEPVFERSVILRVTTQELGPTREAVLEAVVQRRDGSLKHAAEAETVAEHYEPNPRSVWGHLQGLTRLSQRTPWQNGPFGFDCAASRLLATVN